MRKGVQAMTIKEIILEYLKANGYDGLYHWTGCACKVDDLMPCDACSIDGCQPGHLLPCPPECGEHDWHIGDKKND